jgi:predicted SAM-dependent methyltransferase
MKLGFLKKVPLFGPALYRARASYRRRTGSRRLARVLAQNPAARKVVIGASGISDPGWIPAEIEYLNLLRESDWAHFFPPASLDALLAEHVWEHLTAAEGAVAAATCFKYLRPGGYLRLAVPDGLHPDPAYREWVRVGGSGEGADDHKVLYTHQTFSALFERAGFRCRLLEFFDETGRFHFEPWEAAGGTITRSSRFDERNAGGRLNYTSIVMDAVKPP